MKEVIGVRFRSNGKIYYFDPLDYDVNKGDAVIVETAKGTEYGKCVLGKREITDDEHIKELRAIKRLATEEDTAKYEEYKGRSSEAFKRCKVKIREHGLDMKLIAAEYNYDGSKLVFYFTADGRVDFRNLVKDLAAMFKARIELRQVGVRDESRLLGGIGSCGRELCCHSYLSDFVPVSIKMAKEQGLSLNPTKISGVCGRLMCCLNHEEETYEYLNAQLPSVGDHVVTRDGMEGQVIMVNVLRSMIRILVTDENDNKEAFDVRADELAKNDGKRSFMDKYIAGADASNEEKQPRKKKKKYSDASDDESHGSAGDRAGKKSGGHSGDRKQDTKRSDKKREDAGSHSSDRKRDGAENRSGDRKRDSIENRSSDKKRDGAENRSGDKKRDGAENRSGDKKRDGADRRSGDKKRDGADRRSGDKKHEGDRKRQGGDRKRTDNHGGDRKPESSDKSNHHDRSRDGGNKKYDGNKKGDSDKKTSGES